MSGQKAALNVDAPVTLDELLDRNARETLVAGAQDLGVSVAVIDRDGHLILGDSPPQPTIDARPDFEPVELTVAGAGWVVCMLAHEGDAIGWLIVRGAPNFAAHMHRVADAFIVDGIKRAMSARMHMATVEEASRELTEKNRRLAQAVERLQEADRVKSNFLATVSHELRTPLTSVIGYSEMLLEGIAGALNDEQREYVRTVMEKGDQLLQLITGILDISRMEAGEMKIDKHPFDLDEVVSVALSTIAPHARRKKLVMACSVPEALPLVYGDRDKIRQVLLNLLGNAVKFTPEGGRVEVAAQLATLLP
ncbi:MAG: sensor histidine kinase, partial [Polyangia bacterium]